MNTTSQHVETSGPKYHGTPCILDRNYCKQCSKGIVGTAAMHHSEWPVGYYHPFCLLNLYRADPRTNYMARDMVRAAVRVRFERGRVY